MRDSGRLTLCKTGTFCMLGTLLYVFLSFIILALHFMMRQLTEATHRFEGIPSYVVAIHFSLCSGLLVALGRESFQRHSLLLKFGGAVFAIALLLTVSSVVMTLWLAGKQESLVLCGQDPGTDDCRCRNDNMGESRSGWVLFPGMRDCRELGSLFKLMVATSVASSIGGLLCILSIFLIASLYYRACHEEEGDGDVGGGSGWRRLFAERPRLPGSPPSYEESQTPPTRLVTGQRQGEPPPAYQQTSP